MIAEGKEGGSDDDRSSCNFVEFLLLMKKLMERNFCGISQKVEAILKRLEDERASLSGWEQQKDQFFNERRQKRRTRQEYLKKKNAENTVRSRSTGKSQSGPRTKQFRKGAANSWDGGYTKENPKVMPRSKSVGSPPSLRRNSSLSSIRRN